MLYNFIHTTLLVEHGQERVDRMEECECTSSRKNDVSWMPVNERKFEMNVFSVDEDFYLLREQRCNTGIAFSSH